MPISVNNKEITAINFKGKEIVRVHAGLDLVWEKAGDTDSLILIINIPTSNFNFSIAFEYFGTPFNFILDWGDGQATTVAQSSSKNLTHIYTTAGLYYPKITGICQNFNFYGASQTVRNTVLGVAQWGNTGISNAYNMFYFCYNVNIFPDNYIFPQQMPITAMFGAYSNCTSLINARIPGNVIGSSNGSAFSYCPLTNFVIEEGMQYVDGFIYNQFTHIVLPSTVTQIFQFTRNSALTELTCLAVVPPTINAFYFLNPLPATLTAIRVPAASVAAYKAAPVWNRANLVNKIVAI